MAVLAVLLIVPVLLWLRERPRRPRPAGRSAPPAATSDRAAPGRTAASCGGPSARPTSGSSPRRSSSAAPPPTASSASTSSATRWTTGSRRSSRPARSRSWARSTSSGTIASGWLTDRVRSRASCCSSTTAFRGVSLLFLPFVHDSVGDRRVRGPVRARLHRDGAADRDARRGHASAARTSASSTAGSSPRTSWARRSRPGSPGSCASTSATTRRRSSRPAGSRSWPGSRRSGSGVGLPWTWPRRRSVRRPPDADHLRVAYRA